MQRGDQGLSFRKPGDDQELVGGTHLTQTWVILASIPDSQGTLRVSPQPRFSFIGRINSGGKEKVITHKHPPYLPPYTHTHTIHRMFKMVS